MKGSFPLRGVIAAAITPFDRNGCPDAARAIPYYRELLDTGCEGLNLLGTTGEGLSIGLDDRLAFMESVARSGLPLERIIFGTGACALADAIRLTRAACEWGFAGALVIPPFYYRDATDSGVVRFYTSLVDAVRPPKARVLLYNFPRMSGIAFHGDLVERLLCDLGEEIGGLKDSSNDMQLECELHERFPSLAVFPGSEELLLEARSQGLNGCISGSVCLWPELAHAVWSTGDPAQAQTLAQARGRLKGLPLIAEVRACVAEARNDKNWLYSAPPLV